MQCFFSRSSNQLIFFPNDDWDAQNSFGRIVLILINNENSINLAGTIKCPHRILTNVSSQEAIAMSAQADLARIRENIRALYGEPRGTKAASSKIAAASTAPPLVCCHCSAHTCHCARPAPPPLNLDEEDDFVRLGPSQYLQSEANGQGSPDHCCKTSR